MTTSGYRDGRIGRPECLASWMMPFPTLRAGPLGTSAVSATQAPSLSARKASIKPRIPPRFLICEARCAPEARIRPIPSFFYANCLHFTISATGNHNPHVPAFRDAKGAHEMLTVPHGRDVGNLILGVLKEVRRVLRKTTRFTHQEQVIRHSIPHQLNGQRMFA